jgi:hypothetical protein
MLHISTLIRLWKHEKPLEISLEDGETKAVADR